MLSKEEIEEDNTFKMSIPLITNAELNAIDNNLNDFVNQITKQVIHEKDLLVAQHIIKKQKEYIEQLETINDKYLQKLVYTLTPTTHALDIDNNNAFKQIIADNIDLETCKIRRKLKEFWGIDKY